MEAMVKKLMQRKKRENMKDRLFLDNGSIFLEELIADCNGKSIPIRNFSFDQILKATNNFDSTCFVTEESYYKWYKYKIEDRSYMIKRFSDDAVTGHRVGEVYNDIVLSARMSNHNNFLKLLGYCLEFPFPVLVFESAEHGVLNQQGGVIVNGLESSLPLSIRLKIGKEIANALTYLHMAFPKIIIYRDVKPMHVFLNKNLTAKLSDLSYAISLPEGKVRIQAERVMGTMGYVDPSYYYTRSVSEYTDVYSFGVFLMVVLTGKPVSFTGSDGNHEYIISFVKGLYENGKLDEEMEDITSGETERLQVEACVSLALRCCEKKDEERPKMIQVAKELKWIELMKQSLDATSRFSMLEMMEDESSRQGILIQD